jgi:hypothetical protein
MRGGPGGADGAGNGDAVGESGALDAAGEIGDQFVLAVIKMCAAGDVEQ